MMSTPAGLATLRWQTGDCTLAAAGDRWNAGVLLRRIDWLPPTSTANELCPHGHAAALQGGRAPASS